VGKEAKDLDHYVAMSEDEGEIVTLVLASALPNHQRSEVVVSDAIKLWDIFAATPEEASAIHNLRMGHEPYNPMGKPEKCPNYCGAYYYPNGSGKCPLCGDC